MSKWKPLLIALILALVPISAQAHGLIGNGSWLDELICLVPAAIMVVLVFVLGRNPNRTGTTKKDRP